MVASQMKAALQVKPSMQPWRRNKASANGPSSGRKKCAQTRGRQSSLRQRGRGCRSWQFRRCSSLHDGRIGELFCLMRGWTGKKRTGLASGTVDGLVLSGGREATEVGVLGHGGGSVPIFKGENINQPGSTRRVLRKHRSWW